MTQNKLPKEDREFFFNVSQAVVENPFSDRRIELDAKIAGLSYAQMAKNRKAIELFLPRVDERLKKLQSRGLDRIQSFRDEDRSPVFGDKGMKVTQNRSDFLKFRSGLAAD